MYKKSAVIVCTSLFMLIVSNSAMAIGLGAYLNGGAGESILRNYYTNLTAFYTYSKNFKGLNYLFGGGFLLDTCVADDNLFNYRLQIGCDDYISPHAPSWDWLWYTPHYTIKHTIRINMKNTLGFGIFRNKLVRVWIGPNISAYYYPLEKRGHLLVPGLSLGVNYHLNDLISISTECGVNYEWSVPKSHKDDISSVNCHITLGMLFRIIDSYKKKNVYIRDTSIPDTISE